jgi:hypothetical protein
MRKSLWSLVVLAVLSASAGWGQTQEDYDEFGIVDDGKSLDEVAPDDGSLPPPIAAPDDETAPATGGGEAPAEAAAPVEAADAVAQTDPPAGWQAVSFLTLTAALPPDFQLMQEENDARMWFSGDFEAHTGLLFGFALANDRDMLPEGAEIHVDRPATLDGVAYRWRELTADLGDGTMADMIVLSSIDPVDGDNRVLITGMTIGVPFEDYRQVIEATLATVRIGVAPPPPATQDGTALDGLVSYSVPKDWNVRTDQGGLQIGFWPPVYSGYIGIARGAAVDGYDGLQYSIPDGIEPSTASVFDQVADTYTFDGTQAEFQFDGAMVPGLFSYYRLLGCVDGEPIMVVLAGARGWVWEDEFYDVLQGISVDDAAIGRCPDPDAGAAAPAPQEEAAAEPAVPSPESASPSAAAGVAQGIVTDVAGVTYLRPEDWIVNYESADDGIFVSPDGRWSLLSFWWFPDEPLLGYDDITGIENLVIDHEPVTRIFSASGGTSRIQNVTERARNDGKRFIFTLEGTGVSDAELAALHDQLVANLHLQGGFDASKRVDPKAAAAPADSPVAGGEQWTTFVGDRFGTTIDYPAGFLAMQPPPGNDDGRTFRSADGAVTLLVFGQFNIDGLDGPAMMERDRDWGGYEQVTYQSAKADRYVLSGYSGDRVFYRAARIDAGTGVVHVFEIEYPAAEKAVWDPIVTRMAKSFRAG